jgi:hypothetical protein
MSGAPERPQRPRQALFVIALAFVAGVLALPFLLALGMGRVIAEIWVTTMATIAGLLGGLIGS